MYCRISLFCSLLFFLHGCKKSNVNVTPKIIGHAATGLKMPNAIYHDNSEAGIAYTQQLPFCTGVEVDVRMDQSGNLWLFHDETLSPEIAESGCIETHTSSTLAQFHYQGLHQEPLFALTAASATLFHGKFTFFDIKPWNACENTVKEALAFKNALLALGMDSTSFGIIVPNETYFQTLKNEFNVYLTIQSITDLSNNFLENEPKLKGIIVRNSAIREEEVNFLKSIHKEVVIYEVRSAKGIKEGLQKNPDYLITDDVKLTVGILH